MQDLRLKPLINYLARTFGFEAVGEVKRGWNISQYQFHSRVVPREVNMGRGDAYFNPFEVDISRISTRVGFSFSEKGWHPFVQTLREYSENQDLNYRESTLAKVFMKFQPRNVQEVLLGDHQPRKPLCDWPPHNYLLSRIWELNEYSVARYLNQYAKNFPGTGWIYYGPHDETYGEKEFGRLKRIFDSIKQKGYMPEVSASEAITGYFLKNGDQLRFILLHGNHRIAALKALGYSKVKVVIRKGHPAVVDRKALKRWSVEGGGIYPLGLLQEIFDALFYNSGLEKAIRLGLVT